MSSDGLCSDRYSASGIVQSVWLNMTRAMTRFGEETHYVT